MKKLFLFSIFLIFSFNLFGQVTIVIKELPKETPKDASIYISGDFENWSGGQEKYKLKLVENKYKITLTKKENSRSSRQY